MSSYDWINSHYKWLDIHFAPFLSRLGLKNPEDYLGLISAHGDKCWQYESQWSKSGIPFEHGAAIYLLTYMPPWSREVRETVNGWVKPVDWVVSKYPAFKELLDEPKTARM